MRSPLRLPYNRKAVGQTCACSSDDGLAFPLLEDALKTTIILTGEELVRGRSADTNGSFMAAQLADCGFEVRRLTVIGDDPGALKEEMLSAERDSRVILVSGGLGPTADDRTRNAIAEAVGAELVEDEPSRRHVEQRLRSFGRAPTEKHLTQARFPAGAVIFPNPRGTARGFACRKGGGWIVAMPGVPGELVPMFSESVLPFLLKELAPSVHVRSRTAHFFPAPESAVDERITDLTVLGRNPSVGITVRDGVVSVHVVARCRDAAEAETLVQRDMDALEERFGDLLFGCDDATLARALSEELERRQVTIGVTESVTGGLVAHMLVDVPGISRFFRGGVVAYGNEAKVRHLGVRREDLERHGAVSPEVAEGMARGICAAMGTGLGLSTTGVAGPTGGTAQKPVGLVYVGVCFEGAARAMQLNLSGDRWQIKDRAAKHALNAARLALTKGLDLLEPDRSI